MTQSTCTTCPRPVPDTAYGCLNCATNLAGTLGQLAGIVHELDTTVAKQDRLGTGGPRGTGADVPLPYNPGASDRAANICGELTAWAAHVTEQTARKPPRGHPAGAAASLLATSTNWLRYRQEWSAAYAALSPLVRATIRIIDRPADRTYLGPCGHVDEESQARCTADVTARRGAATGTCQACGAVHQVEGALQWMRDQLDDILARPVEIVGLLRRFDEKLSYSVITKYARQGRIAAHGHDPEGRELYRIGDVIEARRSAGQSTPRPGEMLAEGAA